MRVHRFSTFHDYQEAAQPLLASRTYPFQCPWYLEIFAQHFSQAEAIHWLGVYDGEDLMAAGAFEVGGETALFLGMKKVLGGQEVTDYGDLLYKSEIRSASRRTNDKIKMAQEHENTENTEAQKTQNQNLPLLKGTGAKQPGDLAERVEKKDYIGEIWSELQTYFKNLGKLTLQLDYVRQDSLTYQFLNSPFSTLNSKLSSQEVAPYIELPSTWDEYLEALPRVKRKELKRKIRRLEEEKAFRMCDESTIDQDFEDFIRLHRLSDPAKDHFMTEEMKQFFRGVMKATQGPWQMHLCLMTIDDKRVAALLAFYNHERVLFYNSGYDPAYNYYSVGLILKAFNLKHAIEKGFKHADWLRGNERYKYDLGSIDLQLYKIVIDLS